MWTKSLPGVSSCTFVLFIIRVTERSFLGTRLSFVGFLTVQIAVPPSSLDHSKDNGPPVGLFRRPLTVGTFGKLM